jgi:TrmH family RNA methyltransferase
MEISVVVVEPRYQVNLGYIARVSANFSVRSLVLVNPRCRRLGKNAVKYSKHGLPMLRSARVCRSLKAAVSGTFSIGTTGIWRKGRNSLDGVFALDDMAALVRKNGIRRVSIVLGRESTGLTIEELKGCSSIAYIPLEGSYPILNISHALAILLYELSDIRQRPAHIYADSEETGNTVRLFRGMIRRRGDIRSKRTVEMAMAHVLERSHPTKTELSTLAVAFSANKKEKKEA